MVTAQLTPIGVGIHNVLIATDFSRCSRQALDLGLRLARGCKAHSYIVYVLPANEFVLAGPEAYVAAKDACRRDLQQLKADLNQAGNYREGDDYHLYLLEGDVAHCILNFAHEKEIDLIIMGTHGRGGLGKALMGSVAEEVFRGSTSPVLTIGPHCHSETRALAPRNILAAADFTPASERAAQYAAGLACEHRSHLTLLHVFNPKDLEHMPDRDRILRVMEANLESLLKSAPPVAYSLHLEPGRVVPTILRTAEEIDADLLVLGVHRSSGVLTRFMWPNAYELVRDSTCPVLTVRERTQPD